ncbi:MAG: hypothetical protein U0872_07250 [Planctomycetaceae bacterium]
MRYNWSVRLRWIGVSAARLSGNADKGAQFLIEIQDLVGRSAWRIPIPITLSRWEKRRWRQDPMRAGARNIL